MVAPVYVCIEVAGCPTVCQHCWAQGVPYPAMPFALRPDWEEVLATCRELGTSVVWPAVHGWARSLRYRWLDLAQQESSVKWSNSP
jgi:hypothetical protein